MKSNKLKKVLKPLIKECIKEIIFEDGVLSSIIREAQGTSKKVIKEEKPFTKFVKEPKRENKQLAENKAKMRKVFAEKLGGFDPFEGTAPLRETQTNGAAAANPMANIDPSDEGTDISNIPGFEKWGTITERLSE